MAGPTRRDYFTHDSAFTRCKWKGSEYWHPGELSQEIIRILYERHCRGDGPIHYLELMKLAGSLSSRLTARLAHCFKGIAEESLGVLIVESPLRGYYWMNPEIDIPPHEDQRLSSA